MAKFNLQFKTLIFLSVLVLAGCVQQAPKNIPRLSLEARTKYLTNMQHWQANGKVGISSNTEAQNLSIEWQQTKQNYNLYLFSPFSTESARINNHSGKVVLTTADGTFTGNNLDELAAQHLNWQVPFSGLAYWIKGIPSPHSIVGRAVYDQYNQLKLLKQDGWLIEYCKYTVLPRITLPDKITLTNGKLKIKVIVHKWGD